MQGFIKFAENAHDVSLSAIIVLFFMTVNEVAFGREINVLLHVKFKYDKEIKRKGQYINVKSTEKKSLLPCRNNVSPSKKL